MSDCKKEYNTYQRDYGDEHLERPYEWVVLVMTSFKDTSRFLSAINITLAEFKGLYGNAYDGVIFDVVPYSNSAGIQEYMNIHLSDDLSRYPICFVVH